MIKKICIKSKYLNHNFKTKKLNILIGENGFGKTEFIRNLYTIFYDTSLWPNLNYVELEYKTNKNDVFYWNNEWIFKNWFKFLNEISISSNLNKSGPYWKSYNNKKYKYIRRLEDNKIKLKLIEQLTKKLLEKKYINEEQKKLSHNFIYEYPSEFFDFFINIIPILNIVVDEEIIKVNLGTKWEINIENKNRFIENLKNELLNLEDIHGNEGIDSLLEKTTNNLTNLNAKSKEICKSIIKWLSEISSDALSCMHETFFGSIYKNEKLENLKNNIEFIFRERILIIEKKNKKIILVLINIFLMNTKKIVMQKL